MGVIQKRASVTSGSNVVFSVHVYGLFSFSSLASKMQNGQKYHLLLLQKPKKDDRWLNGHHQGEESWFLFHLKSHISEDWPCKLQRTADRGVVYMDLGNSYSSLSDCIVIPN